MESKQIFEAVKKRIDSYREEMIHLQIALTAIPALSPENGGNGEYEKAQFLMQYLRIVGFKDIREFNAPDERVSTGLRPNLVTSFQGKRRDRTVWILSHMDIVPPGELQLWDEDPYKGYVKDGKIYGRGTEDNQQDLVASIFAAKALLDENIIPESSIGLAFVADEETGSVFGLQYLLDHHEKLFRKDDIIVVPDFGNETGTEIEIAEKSLLWLRIRTIGKQCHASKPSAGRNAFVAASHFVVELGTLYRTYDVSDMAYQPPVSTFEPTKKEANIPNVNTIPGDDIFYLDCRVLPIYDLTDIIAKIRNIADKIEARFEVSIEISPLQNVQAPPPTPQDAAVVFALKRAIHHIYRADAVPIGIGGGTVASLFRKRGYPAAVWSKLTQTAHQPNESCIINNMIENAKVYAHVFLQTPDTSPEG